MIARASAWFESAWFEDADPRDLRRWAIAAAIVVAVHVAAICAYLYVHHPDELGDDSSPISVDLAPSDDTVDQAEVAPTPDLQQQPIEQPPPPPPPQPEAVVTPEPPPPQKVEQQPPPTPAMVARTKGGMQREMASWQSNLIKQLEKFKRYPNDARARGDEGTVELGLHARSQRPCACASNRAKLRPCGARCRGHSDDRARSAAAAHSGQHAGRATRSHRPDRLFVALTFCSSHSPEYSRNNHAYQTMPDCGRREENPRRL